MITAVYPGTFDPLTRGHEDLVRRAAGLFDHLVVGIAHSQAKKPFFTVDERVEIAREVLGHYSNVTVKSFDGLLKDFVREQNARVIVRGLRAVSDFERSEERRVGKEGGSRGEVVEEGGGETREGA